jgi:hypothetical protein
MNAFGGYQILTEFLRKNDFTADEGSGILVTDSFRFLFPKKV